MNTVREVVAWLDAAPEGTTLPAESMAMLLRPLADPEPSTITPVVSEPGWRERLWTCPPETRLTMPDLAEAIGKSTSWIYKRTGPKATGERIPCRRLAGELVFVAGEIRGWILESEEIVNASTVCAAPS